MKNEEGELWKACPFDMSVLIWGYELAGDCTEFSATVAENRESQYDQFIHWDHDLPYLMGFEMWYGDQLATIRWWWALCWFVMKGDYTKVV